MNPLLPLYFYASLPTCAGLICIGDFDDQPEFVKPKDVGLLGIAIYVDGILIVPDKRFTFDLNRPTTTFGNVLEKFLLEANHPNVAEVYDHFAMATHVNGHSVWHGILNNKDPQLLVKRQMFASGAGLLLKPVQVRLAGNRNTLLVGHA